MLCYIVVRDIQHVLSDMPKKPELQSPGWNFPHPSTLISPYAYFFAFNTTPHDTLWTSHIAMDGFILELV